MTYNVFGGTLNLAGSRTHLRGGAHEAQFAGADLLAAGEDARDAVRLGDERAVDERERDSGQDAGGGARGRRRLSDQRERRRVGERQTDEDDVAQLARRRLRTSSSFPFISRPPAGGDQRLVFLPRSEAEKPPIIRGRTAHLVR